MKKKPARELLRLRRVASATKSSTVSWRSSRSVFVSQDVISYETKKTETTVPACISFFIVSIYSQNYTLNLHPFVTFS
uniref:hypothetical protein n=1 Tax=Candidatus Ventrimonas sp. TaxID=3048889 RepID=UPI003FEE3222